MSTSRMIDASPKADYSQQQMSEMNQKTQPENITLTSCRVMNIYSPKACGRTQIFELPYYNGYNLQGIPAAFRRNDRLQIKKATKEIRQIIMRQDRICRIPVWILTLGILAISVPFLIVGTVLLLLNRSAENFNQIGIWLLFAGLVLFGAAYWLIYERNTPYRKDTALSVKLFLTNRGEDGRFKLDLAENSYNLQLRYQIKVSDSHRV